ncbi:hypothetical protein LJY25_10205 [Hymenobacter sp. BT175]|uniref:hypothetical protein n=1 Tax=Hymenobacter translucens TaxID=2886507 RepID=UPI001D0EA30B|nr:hypothetical protein [Hymenobacter translucens]MCC2546816.1 hypothetical protein [Hymenobacter translucens]
MRYLLLLSALFFSVLSALSGCSYDNEEDLFPPKPNIGPCDTTAVLFSANVLPILQANCYRCHTRGNSLGGNIDLETFASLQRNALSGTLAGTVAHRNGFNPMPVGAPRINACDVAIIRTWARNGAQNN